MRLKLIEVCQKRLAILHKKLRENPQMDISEINRLYKILIYLQNYDTKRSNEGI